MWVICNLSQADRRSQPTLRFGISHSGMLCLPIHARELQVPENRAASTRPTLVLRKVRQILECFTLESPDRSLREIVDATGLPASTCQRLVQNLVAEGFLDKDGDVYRVGLGLVRLAAPGSYGMDLVKVSRPVLESLRDGAGETAYLQVRDGPYRTIVGLAEARNVVVRRLSVGMVMPLHVGSAGKVFLAFDPEAWNDALAHGLRPSESNRPVDVETLQLDVAAVRDQGYAVTYEERDAGTCSVSAAVYDSDGTVCAAVGVAAPIQRFDEAVADRVTPLVVDAGRQISELLGYRVD